MNAGVAIEPWAARKTPARAALAGETAITLKLGVSAGSPAPRRGCVANAEVLGTGGRKALWQYTERPEGERWRIDW